MTMPLNDRDIAARAPNKVAAEIDDETVILDVESGNYFRLNKSGARIWHLLEAPLSLANLCARLEATFEVDADTCRAEAISFLEKMREKRLVEIRSS